MTKQEKSKLVKRLAESICALYEEADKAETCPDCGKGEKTQPAEPPKENLGEASKSKIKIANVQLGWDSKPVKVSSFQSVEDFLGAVYKLSKKAGAAGSYESLQIDFDMSDDDNADDDTYDVQITEMDD